MYRDICSLSITTRSFYCLLATPPGWLLVDCCVTWQLNPSSVCQAAGWVVQLFRQSRLMNKRMYLMHEGTSKCVCRNRATYPKILWMSQILLFAMFAFYSSQWSLFCDPSLRNPQHAGVQKFLDFTTMLKWAHLLVQSYDSQSNESTLMYQALFHHSLLLWMSRARQ